MRLFVLFAVLFISCRARKVPYGVKYVAKQVQFYGQRGTRSTNQDPDFLFDNDTLTSSEFLAMITAAEKITAEELNFITLSAPTSNKTLTENPFKRNQLAELLKPKLDQVPEDSPIKIAQPARSGQLSKVQRYIVGGQETNIRQFPWQAAIVVDNKNFCGGSLITASHVLTAAHCTDVYFFFKIYLGGSSLPPTSEPTRIVVSASKKTIHPDWNPEDMSDDIAILTLAKSLTAMQLSGAAITTLRLPALSMAEDTFENTACNISGWGLNETGGALTKTLNYITVTVVPTITCADEYGDIVASSTLCCVAKAGSATCQGDSGGPLVMREADKKFTQIGIVSFGPEVCGEAPLGFTRVTSYLGWISNVAGIALRKTV